MGNVAAIIKVFPESAEVLPIVKKEIEEKLKPAKIEEEPIAFGLMALKVLIFLDDNAGSEGLEDKIKAIKGVSEAQIEDITRI
ncbi:elongation factor 1-beta [Candidatus Micrarchaeota archaeon]|nr:elongation factor 1-beta [Candidatus Micrarchaeota archaeon]